MATATAKDNISLDALGVNTAPTLGLAPPPRHASPERFIKARSTSPPIMISSVSLGSPNRSDQIPLQKCFAELNYMSQLLAEVERKDHELSYVLQSVRGKELTQEEREDSSEKPSEIPSSVAAYQEFVDSFISLLLQSKFLGFTGGVEPQQDPHNIIRNLVAYNQCPDFCLFKRIVVDPTLVASSLPEDENPAIYKNIPVNQLARFCDIAVLKFLSTINEHTSASSVIWALDYLQNLLNSLITSLNSMSSFGWYAAPSIRIKKGTILTRRSVHAPPNPPLPPVVVHSPDHPSHNFSMEYPPSVQDLIPDPETGQRNPSPSPYHQSPQPQRQSAATGKGPPSGSGSLPAEHRHQGGEVAEEGGRQRRVSREEKAPFLTINRTNSPPERSPERSPSPSPRGSGVSPASSLSGDSLPLPFQYTSTSPSRRLSPAASPTFRLSPTNMGPIPEENKANEDLGMDSAERDYFLDIIAEIGPPVPPRDYLQPQPAAPPPAGAPRLSLTDTRHTLGSIQEEDEELPPVELGRSSPVIFGRGLSPGLDDDQFSDTTSSQGAGEEGTVRSKPLSLPPLELKDAPKFDEQKELDVLMNGEGRVSLLAILQAIANLPQSQDLWTENLCLKCFSLIQLCMNLGLTQADEPNEALSAQDRRKQFQKRQNVAFQKLGSEKPFKVHSSFIVEYSVKALIHCASNMIIGCTNDNGFCRLSYRHLPNQNRIIYDKLIRNLRRLHLHSSPCFRQALIRFASVSSCQKLFHFLHVVLQYCLQGEHLRLDSLMVAIVASVLRTAVDRLVELDIRERAIQNSITAEACCFFQYAQTIFSQESLLKTQTFRHLHMYIHRVALSIILPPRPHKPELPNSPELTSPKMENNSPSIPLSPQGNTDALSSIPLPPEKKVDSFTLPYKRLKHAVTVDASSRGRAESLPTSSSEGVRAGAATASQQRSKARRGQLTKQQSVHHDPDALDEGGVPKLNAPGMEWRGLRLDLLRSRVQRLVVLMETSEPGTMPDAGMLAALIDLGDGKSVVSRAMVFLECALFVGNLHSQEWPLWTKHNREGCSNVAMNLRRWGEAIGEKLRLTELREREMINRHQAISHSASGSIILPEEPVFPDDSERSTNLEGEERPEPIEWTVSYALKMAACILLLEITRFLRDPPPQFTSGVSISPQISAVHLDRKVSNTSVISSDVESARTLHPDFRPMLGRPLSDYPSHYASSLSVEESDLHDVKSHSFDEQGATAPRKRRVSVYLHVNHNRSNSVRKQTVVRFFDSPGEVRPARSHSPSLRGRRQSLSTGSGGAGGQFHLGGSVRSRPVRRPTLASGAASATVGTFHPQPLKYRRKSASAILSKTVGFSEGEARPPLLSQYSNVSNKGAGGLGNSLNLGFSRLKRTAKAFRRNIIKKKGDVSTPGAEASSPNMTQRKRLQQQRLSQMGSSSQVLLVPEDCRRYYPWLDIMEHLILVDAFDPEGRKRHKKACLELVTILKAVYVDETSEEDISVEQTDDRRSSRNLSSIFAGPLLLVGEAQEQSVPSSSATYGRHSVPANLGAPRRRSSSKSAAARSTSVPTPRLTQASTSTRGSDAANVNPLATLKFTNLNCARFTSSFLAATSRNEEGSIELFLEEESAFTRAHISKQFNQQRREYLKASFSSLIHAPFSLLVHAAPILHATTFNNLKEVAWDMLLDPDHETAEAAGAFFLLACAKESDVMVKRFVSDHVIKAGPTKQREALQRFMVLWQTRYHVWPRMEERAQKKFHMYTENDKDDSQDQQSIGYSLPANLLGSSGAAVPMAPWDPVSVCTGTTCDDNPDKCFRPTRLAPVLHPGDISKHVNTYSVSGVSVPQEASSKPANVYYGVGSEDSTGNINDIQWEAVEPTLFPRSLLPLICFVITSLSSHSSSSKVSSSTSSTSFSSSSPSNTSQDPHISELARQAVWTCMVEDSRLFFRPLLNQFNNLYKLVSSGSSDHQVDHLLAEILKPLHVVLQAFPSLPPRAAHFLFNNFVGIIMRHTDQPYTPSDKIIQSVLTLIGMVVPCVQGLDSKLLKSILKKENCYTTIMTTARIRGVEKVHLLKEHSPHDQKSYEVGDDMTFGQLIADGLDENLSVELLQNWYLVDEGKDLPLLSSQVIQDHYSVPSDGQYPTFIVRHAGQRERMWNKQLEQLFVHKMSEVMRVAFTTQLLLTGPEVEKGFTYSEFAQPNYRFVHSELVELNSFPRKALTSILYEVGPTALQHGNLRASDIMLKGMWVRFVLQLFRSIKPDYDLSNSMILFLNVVNGALLLHSENHTILRFCLASLLTAAGKFNAIFKQDGYQMIVPTLIQVYALHMQNSLITNALKFTWCQLYLLDNNIFLLQAIAATATLLSEEAYILSSNVNSTFTAISRTSHTMEGELAQRQHAKAVFELLEALNEELPPDELDILACCPQVVDQDGRPRLNPENRQRFSLQNTFSLCVTLATWNPEALRGMQVLVFLDHLMPLFLRAFTSIPSPTFLPNSVKYLIKGCDAISKRTQAWKGDTSKGGGGGPVFGGPSKPHAPEDRGDGGGGSKPESRRTSVIAFQQVRKLINPKKKEFSSKVRMSEGSVYYPRPKHVQAPTSSLVPIDHRAYVGEFKLHRIHDVTQRLLKLSRESLLSLSSQFILHSAGGELQGKAGVVRKESTSRQERPRAVLDNQALLVLTAIAVQLLKQGEKNNEIILQGKGLNSYMSILLPSLDWSEPYYSSFNNLIARINKLFKKLHEEPNKALLVWDNLATFITGIAHCIQRSPHLVAGHDQHFSKLKALLEIIVGMTSDHSQKDAFKGMHRHLLHNASASFSDAVVKLAAELIVVTRHCPNPKFRYHISDLLSQRLTLKELPKDIILHKMLLPLCIQLGLREETGCPSEEDVGYMLQFVYKDVENVLKLASNTGHPCQVQPLELFFRELKVICCAFAEVLTLCHWHKVAQWVLSLSQRKFATSVGKKISTISIGNDQGGTNRWSRHSSTSSTPGSSLLNNFIAFHNSLLNFFESFLLVYRVPLFSLLWPLLGQMESQLIATLQSIKADTPAMCDKIHSCIDRYRSLQARGSDALSSMSRNILLREFQDELKHLSSATKTMGRSHTTLEKKRPLARPILRRRGSASLSNIGEVHEEEEALLRVSPPKSTTEEPPRKKLEARPTFLQLVTPPSTSEQKKSREPNEKKVKIFQPHTLPKQQHKRLGPMRRNQRKRSPVSPGDASPSQSPVAPRRRPPPLAQLRGIGSSEQHADTEDFDSVSPEDNVKTFPPKLAQLTILAEVHEPHPQPQMPQSHSPSREAADTVYSCSGNGHDQLDTSETLLLPTHNTTISTQSSFSQSETYDVLSETDGLLQQRSGTGAKHKTSRSTVSPIQPRKKSLSLDRKELSVSFRELGTGIKSESSPSVKYMSLKDITGEDTEC